MSQINSHRLKVLFIAYQEASNPLMMYSQGLPYMLGLLKKGVEFSLLTYENQDSLDQSKIIIKNTPDLKWYFLTFNSYSGLFFTFLDILKGTIKAFYIIRTDSIKIVHCRGLIPALIAYLPVKVLRKKLFFDTRGLLADKYSSGGIIKHDGLIYRTIKNIEKFLLGRCDYFTLETHRHSQIIDRCWPAMSDKQEVIPCCIDTEFFKAKSIPAQNSGSSVAIVYLGKTGTWHKTKEMFDFFKIMEKELPGSSFLFLTTEAISEIVRLAIAAGLNLQKLRVINPKREDIPALIREANAGIFFINSDRGYNSSHIKFGEYLSCGLPVIVNEGIGDTADIIRREKVGVIIDRFSESEYKLSIGKLKKILAQGDNLRIRCSTVAKKYFSLEAGVEKYLNIYRRLS